MRYQNVVVAIASLIILASSFVGPVRAQECGDVNNSGGVTASDALLVLQKSVALPVMLTCASSDCEALEARVEALEGKTQCITANSSDTYFEGCNVHIQNGADATLTKNGRGNLIIGYDEDNGDDKSGSHNIVLGPFHDYRASAGFVGGTNNKISAQSAVVVGGDSNIASATGSVVVGGYVNQADGSSSVVVAGNNNLTSDLGSAACIVGGEDNLTEADSSVVVAGKDNSVTGYRATVLGGINNTNDGRDAVILGGSDNSTSGIEVIVP